ncbi:MAG: signal peptidase II [Ignavibacteria bacterium]|nr:signal peptidase II [Ignavibacteria bacterium]
MRTLYLTLVVVVLDQFSKLWIKGFSLPFLNLNHVGMIHGDSIPVWGNFFRITFVENPGMAFGIGLLPAAKLIICLFTVIACVGLIYYLYTVRDQSLSLRIALALILAGALGNLIDRSFYGLFYGYEKLFYGKVVDFFDFDFFDITFLGRSYDRFPIFNVADSAVTIGVAILLLFYKKHQAEIQTEAQTAEGAIVSEDDIATTPEEQIIGTENPDLSDSKQQGNTPHTSTNEKADEQVNNRTEV